MRHLLPLWWSSLRFIICDGSWFVNLVYYRWCFYSHFSFYWCTGTKVFQLFFISCIKWLFYTKYMAQPFSLDVALTNLKHFWFETRKINEINFMHSNEPLYAPALRSLPIRTLITTLLQVLIHEDRSETELQWITSSAPDVPYGAIVAGHKADGKPLYVAKVKIR